jgi:O-antigen/teichoic acid export membrane protein
MKWFVVTLCVAFLFTSLYIDLWQYFVASQYRSGLGVVPILLAANIALGIYYNLSVWYKITDRMYMGMLITLAGAAVTIGLNVAFIPTYGMYACAWATLAAYVVMMGLSYGLGQRYYPVPYATGKLLGYIAIMLALYGAQQGVVALTDSVVLHMASATVLMGAFLGAVLVRERQELAGMPVIGKWLK